MNGAAYTKAGLKAAQNYQLMTCRNQALGYSYGHDSQSKVDEVLSGSFPLKSCEL